MNASNNTVKSFALGYKATNTVINGVANSTSAVVATASETKQVSTSFFSGIKFAINERRGRNEVMKSDVTKREESERKLREAQELYARAHAAHNKGSLIVVAE